MSKLNSADSTKIAFFGHPGSFTHIAAELFIERNNLHKTLLIPCQSIKEVFQYVDTGHCYGTVPVSNNTAGEVKDFVEESPKHSFVVVDEAECLIQHNLLASPHHSPDHVPKKIISHSQALQQCSRYLKSHHPNAKITPYANTSTAARDLANGTLKEDDLVIASGLAAELYGLQVLAKDIQDSKENATKFQFIAKVQDEPLKDWRTQIDKIDRSLVELLAERFKVTRQIGAYKVEKDIPLVDGQREAELLKKIESIAKANDINPQLASEIVRSTIDEVKKEHAKLAKKS